MFRNVGDQPSLWESILPEQVCRLPEELARVDASLDDPAFFAPFVGFVSLVVPPFTRWWSRTVASGGAGGLDAFRLRVRARENESAGRVKSTKTRHGNSHLTGALGTAALAASRSKGTYLAAKYRRIAARRGPMKALVAVEHAMLVTAWHMLRNGEFYRDPGADYFTRRIPAKTKAHAIGQLEALGYRVSLQPLTNTA